MKVIKVRHSLDEESTYIQEEIPLSNSNDEIISNFMKSADSGSIAHLINDKDRSGLLLTPAGYISSLKFFLNYLKKSKISKHGDCESLTLDQARKTYPNTNNLSIGTYTIHPRNIKMLTPLEYYHRNLALDKDNELIVLLGRMGAKQIKIVEQDISATEGSVTAKVEVLNKGGDASANIASHIEQGKELIVEFEGNPTEIETDLLAKSNWFNDDSQMNGIFEARRYNVNKMESYTLRNTYTNTFDFDFNLALKYVVSDIDLKADYKSISKRIRLFQVEFGKKKIIKSKK